MPDDTPPFHDHESALRGIARTFAMVADFAYEGLESGITTDDLIVTPIIHDTDPPNGLLVGTMLYLCNVVNMGPEDLADLAADILAKLPTEGTNHGDNRNEAT